MKPIVANNQNDTIISAFEQWVGDYSQLPAFSHEKASINYAHLDELSREFATYLLHNTDLRKGDRVAIVLPNLLQFTVVFYGLLRAGMVAVTINPHSSLDEMQYLLKDSGARIAVMLDRFVTVSQPMLSHTQISQVVWTSPKDFQPFWRRCWSGFKMLYHQGREGIKSNAISTISLRSALRLGRQADVDFPEIARDDLALIQYTGGTTGQVKGAMLHHRHLLANLRQIRELLGSSVSPRKELVIAALPLYHIYSLTLHCLVMPSLGSHSVLVEEPRKIDRLVDTMSQYPFTFFAGLNTLFVSLCRHPFFIQLDFQRLKVVCSGGVALTPSTAALWKRITGCEILEGYGLTEASPVVAANHPGNIMAESVGQALSETQVCVVNEEGNFLAQGETGELWVKGPQVMSGYWNDAEKTRQAFEGEWFKTGDIARLSSQGFISIVDRKKDVINVSGFTVYPSQLENVISCHPDILECAIVGLPDDVTGEAIKLYVVSESPRLSIREIRDYCRERLTSYKVPRQVEFRKHLPHNSVGKVLRRQLRDEELQAQRFHKYSGHQ